MYSISDTFQIYAYMCACVCVQIWDINGHYNFILFFTNQFLFTTLKIRYTGFRNHNYILSKKAKGGDEIFSEIYGLLCLLHHKYSYGFDMKMRNDTHNFLDSFLIKKVGQKRPLSLWCVPRCFCLLWIHILGSFMCQNKINKK